MAVSRRKISTLTVNNTMYDLRNPPPPQIASYTLDEFYPLWDALEEGSLLDWARSAKVSWAFMRVRGQKWESAMKKAGVSENETLTDFITRWTLHEFSAQEEKASLFLANELGVSKNAPLSDSMQQQMMDLLKYQRDEEQAELIRRLTEQMQLFTEQMRPLKEVQDLFQILVVLLMETFKYTSGVTERGDNEPFKLALYNFYGHILPPANSYPPELTCALAGLLLDSASITATHLWKYEWASSVKLFDMDHIDDPRNGLLLFKLFAEAYNRGHICFVLSEETHLFECHVLDKRVLDLTLTDYDQFIKSNSKKPPNASVDDFSFEAVQRQYSKLNKCGITHMRDIHKRKLTVLPTKEPHRRILNIQARLTRHRAKTSGTLFEPHWDFTDFASEGEYTGKCAVEDWIAQIRSV